MNNLFKIRKVNKALKIFSDSFLGFREKKIDKDLKDFYEKELQSNGINVILNFPYNGDNIFNLFCPNINIFVNINTF
jgi:hypothetical protein